jgi:hypothetical protein
MSIFDRKPFPATGDKVRFTGADKMFYPHFTNLIENARQKLEIGKVYTVLKCEVFSSWSAVWLVEIGDEEMDKFNTSMFEHPLESATEYVEKLDIDDESPFSAVMDMRKSINEYKLLRIAAKTLQKEHQDFIDTFESIYEKLGLTEENTDGKTLVADTIYKKISEIVNENIKLKSKLTQYET